jgi:DNA-binding protein HU-beta
VPLQADSFFFLVFCILFYPFKGGKVFMTKAELIEKIGKGAGLSRAASEKTLNVIINGVTNALKKGNKVTLVGFGTFSVVTRKGRIGRNPRTSVAIRIPAHKAPKFRAGKALKDAVK